MKLAKIIIFIVLISIMAWAGFSMYRNKNTQSIQNNSALIKQRDISEIKKFEGNQDIEVEFSNESRSSYDETVPVNVYQAGANQYEVDARNSNIIQFGPSSAVSAIGDGTAKPSEETRVFSSEELETMARNFIANHTDIQLDKLTPNHGSKGTNYFFKWEDRSQKTTEGYRFVQVGFTQGGTLLSYIDAF